MAFIIVRKRQESAEHDDFEAFAILNLKPLRETRNVRTLIEQRYS